MENNNNNLNESGKFTRFFWNACGAEISVLERCGNNDKVKYFCLGGIVLATGIMAAFAGGYAFYTIFQPKSYVLSESVHFFTAFFAIIFGCLWGLMIFNLDRFIVASSGIGDGTEKITKNELLTALPRIIMGIVIAITISKPIEIRIFKTEIDNELYKEQLAEKASFTQDVNNRNVARRGQLENELGVYNKRLNLLTNQITKKEDEAETERIKRGGRGPETIRLEKEAANLREEKAVFVNNNAARITDVKAQMDQINSDAQGEIKQGDKVASQLDGLLKRIKLAHQIAGWQINFFITLLFIVIELMPIFFKMMIPASNYDKLLDDFKKNRLIENGLVPDDADGGAKVKNVLADEAARQANEKAALQKEIFDKVIEKYKADIFSQIECNYKDFINAENIKVDIPTDADGKIKPFDFSAHSKSNPEIKIKEKAPGEKQNKENEEKPKKQEAQKPEVKTAPLVTPNLPDPLSEKDENYTGPDFEVKNNFG